MYSISNPLIRAHNALDVVCNKHIMTWSVHVDVYIESGHLIISMQPTCHVKRRFGTHVTTSIVAAFLILLRTVGIYKTSLDTESSIPSQLVYAGTLSRLLGVDVL